MEAAANSENAGRATARRLDELDRLVPLQQNTDYKLEKAVERQQDADERLRQLTKELKELAKRKPEKRPASAKKAKGSDGEQAEGQGEGAGGELEAPTSAPSKVSFQEAHEYAATSLAPEALEKVKAEIEIQTQKLLDDMRRDLRKSVLESAERKIKEELESVKQFTGGRIDRLNKRLEALSEKVDERAQESDKNREKIQGDFGKLKKA